MAVVAALLVTGCSKSPGDGPTPAKPVDFPTAFAQISKDAADRVTAAKAAADPVAACRDLAANPLGGWVSALSDAADAYTKALNAYMIRVQLAVYKCQDGTGTAADLTDMATRADAVRAAIAKASATARPTPTPTAVKTVLSSSRAALSWLGSLCQAALAGPAIAGKRAAAASEPGFDLYRQVSGIVRGGNTVDGFRQTDAALRALKPCNAAQAEYLQGNIEFNGWLAAEAACKEAFYYDAKTLGDVFGPWLSCIGPVNLAIVAASKKTSNMGILNKPCTDGYQPPPFGPSPGLLSAQVLMMATQIKDLFDTMHDMKETATMLKTGFKVYLGREITPGEEKAFVTAINVKLEGIAYDMTAEGVRERLRVLTFPPMPDQPPTAPADVVITVTETVPGMQPATGTNKTTIKN